MAAGRCSRRRSRSTSERWRSRPLFPRRCRLRRRRSTASASWSSIRMPDGRELLRTVLQQRGAAVRTAASVDDALESLESWRPDVLVSDSGSPEHDSYALVGKVQSLESDRGGRIPAAALTALRAHRRARAADAGSVSMRSAQAGGAGHAHRGDRPADRPRAAARRAQQLTAAMRTGPERRRSVGVELQTVRRGARAGVGAGALVPSRS